MVWVLQCYVDGGRLNKRQTRPKFSDICYLSCRKSDIGRHQLSKIQLNTHIPMRLCSHLCITPFLFHTSSHQPIYGQSWGEPTIFLYFCWWSPHFIVQVNGKTIYSESRTMTLILFLLQDRHQRWLSLEIFSRLISHITLIRVRSLYNSIACCDGPIAFKLLLFWYCLWQKRLCEPSLPSQCSENAWWVTEAWTSEEEGRIMSSRVWGMVLLVFSG